MRVKFILPALTEALSPYWRPIKYSLFPPLGLATLAAYLDDADEVTIEDEHVQPLNLEDEPELVAIEVYITSAYRAYELADHYRRKGAYVCLGGLHVTSLPQEAALHADSIFIGPGEDTWQTFLKDFRAGHPEKVYSSSQRTLEALPFPRRDLFQRNRYLVPNSLVVSRGCPHTCDFCYKTSFYQGGKSFYTLAVERALAEIDSLPGKHLYFLDDHLFGDPRFASALFSGMQGMGRVWQAAATVRSVLQGDLVEKAATCGLRSLFIGFETLDPQNLVAQNKRQNLYQDYSSAIRRLRDLGVMVNASFVFGLNQDDRSVFERTVEWAVRQGIETATFHILTPYPQTALYHRLNSEQRILHKDWNRYDTRHAVFQPARMSPNELEEGYWQSYRDFYSWSSIARAAWTKASLSSKLRHLAYSAGWKKAEPLWDFAIRHNWLPVFLPVLEGVLEGNWHSSQRVVPDAVDLVNSKIRRTTAV
jgi:radical SAM superfamily enzyme YgiQ (UPF0313 family)